MAKDYLRRYIKVLIRHGKDTEALNHLINKEGYDMVDAQVYIINAKIEVDSEHYDD